MAKDDAASKAARTAMATASGTDLAGFDAQLKTTRMFYQPAEAVAFTTGPELAATMQKVAKFSFDHGLLGEGAASADVVGIGYPGGKTSGDKANVKLRFSEQFMKLAADGKL